jgi:hypothetical protein
VVAANGVSGVEAERLRTSLLQAVGPGEASAA